MPILVQKYGGSSVADVERMGRVADRVVAAKRAGYDVVVVVSAMGKTTDQLLAMAKSAAAAGVASPIDPPRRELDMLVSTGERVSMALLSIAIHARGFDAVSLTGSQSGILTNDRHFDARILEVRPHRIEDELARGKIVIVAGYQGMSYRREITTLGRGGSDTTAVALAAALGAERCEIYSDVDGVYSADPRVVGDPVHLPELDLDVLAEMAEAGAKVLNAQAVQWAKRARIAIHARKTSDPLSPAARETIARTLEGAVGVRAVVGLPRVTLVRAPHAEAAALVRMVAEIDVPVAVSVAQADGLAFAVPLANVPDWNARRARLDAAVPSVVCENVALVSVVGDELTASGDAAQRFLRALARAEATPFMWLSMPLRLSACVPEARREAAERALHTEFVDGPADVAEL